MHTRTTYANGQPVFCQDGETLTYFFKTGQKKAEGASIDGVMQGTWHFWRESGEFWQEGNFRDGQKHGPWRRFARDGTLESDEVYVDGKRRRAGS
jgi:antitoxin component YwqK of YwqJK toxin-antitoxin module